MDLEPCVFVEDDNRLRSGWLPPGIVVVREQPKTLEGLCLPVRIWRWWGETAPTLHPGPQDPLTVRVFREEVQPVREEPERPLYDELKVNVKLTAKE